MVEPPEATFTARLRDGCRATHADSFGVAAQAVAQQRWRRTLEPIRLLRERAEMLPEAVVRDALHAGLDWWQIADYLNMHPQDAWELYQCTVKGTPSPAEQRRDLAVSLCAGVDVLHEFDAAYGADLDELTIAHSLHRDPTVSMLREAAALLDIDIWIAVNPPGEAAPGIAPGAVALAWSSVVGNLGEIDQVRQALQDRRSHFVCLPIGRPHRAPA